MKGMDAVNSGVLLFSTTQAIIGIVGSTPLEVWL
jgi:hypothetical protein